MNAFTSKPKLDWLKDLQKNEKSRAGGQKRAAQMGWQPEVMKTTQQVLTQKKK